MIENNLHSKTYNILINQLNNFWKADGYSFFNEKNIFDLIPKAFDSLEECYSSSPSSRFFCDGKMVFNPFFSITWMLFLYRLSRELYLINDTASADCVYYLNKILHSNDWFYQVDLPTHFMAEHPLGSVLGKAKYGDYFFVYQGTTVGGNRNNGIIQYPTIGNNVLMYANSTVLGNTIIGDNVIISANSYLINEQVPDNSIVFGQSPNLIIKNKDESTIKKMTSHIWKI